MTTATSPLVTFTVQAPPSNTALANLIATLSAGQVVSTLADTGLNNTDLYAIQWENKFFYDEVRYRAYMLGKFASSQGSQYRSFLYSESGNSWTIGASGGSELGHVYSSFAIDRSTDETYTGNWNTGYPKKQAMETSLAAWTEPATAGYSLLRSGVQAPMAWHPNLFGTGDGGLLLLVADGSSVAHVIGWRKFDNSWVTYTETATSVSGTDYPDQGAVEYVRGGNFAIVAMDPRYGGKTWRIPAGSATVRGTAIQVTNVPIVCGYTDDGGNVGILVDDPSGAATPYILEKGGSSKVWKYNAGNWDYKSLFTHPFETGNSRWVIASCYLGTAAPYGAFWRKTNVTGSLLWRPNS